jgi:hypothetical protein
LRSLLVVSLCLLIAIVNADTTLKPSSNVTTLVLDVFCVEILKLRFTLLANLKTSPQQLLQLRPHHVVVDTVAERSFYLFASEW